LPPKVPRYIYNIIDFYYKIQTQWNVGFGGRVGLNYQSVKQTAEIFEFDLNDFSMSVIQEIEYFILQKDNSK